MYISTERGVDQKKNYSQPIHPSIHSTVNIHLSYPISFSIGNQCPLLATAPP
jgi:hypothetical protein